LVIFLMLLAVSLWIQWNQRHYGHNNKRTQPPLSVKNMETAERAGLTLAELERLQAARRAVVDFDDADCLQVRSRGSRNDPGP
jgi:hypothetical protein